MVGELKATWGNPYTRLITVYESDGVTTVDLTNYTIIFTVKDNLAPNNDDTALIKTTCVNDEDQVTNKGQTTLSITKTENKFEPGTYSADFKIFISGVPTNSSRVKYTLRGVVGKDEV